MVIRGYDVVTLARKTWAEIGKDRVSVYAAQMAYSFFFALFPLLLFFAALLSLVSDKETVMAQFNGRIADALPGDVASLLSKTIASVVFAKGAPGLLSFGLLTAAWSGSSIFGALRTALNVAYDVEETRPLWKQYALQLGMLLLAGGVLVASTIILVNGEGVVSWIGSHLGLSAITRVLWTVVQFPLAIAAVVAVLWLVYYFLPNCRHQNKKILLVGATLSTLLWILATLLFRLYVQKFNALNPAYGAIGAIMVLLSWMYYTSFVLLAVGELMAEMEAGTGRVDKPTEEQPLSGAGVPRSHALVVYHGNGGNGDGTHRGRHWAAFDWLPPVRVVRRARRAADAAHHGLVGAVQNVHGAVSVGIREVGTAIRHVGEGTMLCAIGATIAVLGALSLITGIILVIGDQWLPDDWYAIAALLVAVIAGLVAGVLARRGATTFSRAFADADATRRAADATPRHRPATQTRAAAGR